MPAYDLSWEEGGGAGLVFSFQRRRAKWVDECEGGGILGIPGMNVLDSYRNGSKTPFSRTKILQFS